MLKRLGLTFLIAVSLAACGPKAATNASAAPPKAAAATPAQQDADAGPPQPKPGDPNDPFTKLRPWKSANPDVKKTANGVEYVILKHGDAKGAHPKPTEMVEVTYDGRLAADGKRFDATEGADTASFQLNQVIPGWTEGLQELVPGDQAMFFIPAKMGYGAQGAGGRIPPNADLMFLVSLKAITKPKESDAAAWKKATPWPKAGVEKTKSGLEYMIVSSGPKAGDTPKDTDGVLVYYSGRLADGMEFDSVYAQGHPEPMEVGALIPGWREALKLMHVGDHWIMKLPPDLAFGKEARGPIPANSTIYVECELEKVIHIDAPPPGAAQAPGDPSAQAPQPAQPAQPAKPTKPAKPK